MENFTDYVAHAWIKYKICPGCSTFLWHDNWHPLGYLFKFCGSRVLEISLTAKVSSIIDGDDWKRPRVRNYVIQEIMANTPVDLKPLVHNEDAVIWTLSPSGVYSSKSAWQALRTSKPVVPWFGLFGSSLMFLGGKLSNGWLAKEGW